MGLGVWSAEAGAGSEEGVGVVSGIGSLGLSQIGGIKYRACRRREETHTGVVVRKYSVTQSTSVAAAGKFRSA